MNPLTPALSPKGAREETKREASRSAGLACQRGALVAQWPGT